ncbi:hypothetical protein NDI56_15710 [Haloarcula sp. S1CR25-12]|uniref:DUF4239 domain-containing protein n=1 Tax=Haloarcula saliterrae TaxID=2950534 RepID=A0ABU2FGB5_9EURY|nr:hypothetical protein [Haloarcula sp. S1CR25-12]MDS0260851.1 hypothetical protein [Haloarcula sp. S1CR25-12]
MVTAAVVLVTLALLLVFQPVPRLTDRNITPLLYAFSALIGGNLNLLTIVVSINQLVLTRELKSPGKFREEIAGIRELREDVASVSDEAFEPLTPAKFALSLLDAMDEELATLRESGDDRREAFAARLTEDIAAVRAALDRPVRATDEIVIALLAVDFAELYHRVDRLRQAETPPVSSAERESVDRLAAQLELLAVTREHFKQLFTRESLSNMSRILLYVGVPAETFMAVVLLRFIGLFGATSVAPPLWLVNAAVAAGLAPLAVVFAYVLRAATIARRTATATQFKTGAERL